MNDSEKGEIMLVHRIVVCVVIAAACVSMSVDASQTRRSKSLPTNRAAKARRNAMAPRVRKATTKETPESLQKLAIARATLEAEDEKRASGLHVFQRSGLDEELQRNHRKVTEILEQINFIPQARLAHFQWIAAKQFPMKGWSGNIQEVTPISNGFKVKLSVSPTSGTGLQYADHVTEYYTIVNNQVQFLALEPASPEGMRYSMSFQ